MSGQVNANLRLRFDGAANGPEGDVECLKTSFSYYKFPYRIEYAKGFMGLKDDVLTLGLVG